MNTDTEFEKLADAMVSKLTQAGSADEVEKYAAALQHLTESQRTKSAIRNQESTLRREQWQSWSTILVPFFSILTLAVTLFTQVQDNKSARLGAESSAWRDMIKTLSIGQRESAEHEFAVITELKSFMKSENYSKDARDVAVFELQQVVSDDVFENLFSATFAKPSIDDLNDLARISRSLSDEWSAADKQLHNLPATRSGAGEPRTESEFRTGIPDLSPEVKLTDTKQFLAARMRRVNTVIADLLRQRSQSGASGSPQVNLGDLWFLDLDLKDVDFANMTLHNTVFQDADLHGAVIEASAGAENDDFGYSEWWNAKFISKPVLQSLMTQNYPYWFSQPGNDNNTFSYGGGAINEAEYRASVRRLCAAVHLKCADRDIPFGANKPNSG